MFHHCDRLEKGRILSGFWSEIFSLYSCTSHHPYPFCSAVVLPVGLSFPSDVIAVEENDKSGKFPVFIIVSLGLTGISRLTSL